MSVGIITNLASAGAITAIILTMSVVKNPFLKALIYSLPIPITIALIATGGHVDSSNIIGLALLSGFLWMVCLLAGKTGILWADVGGAILYVALGYGLISLIHPPFWASVAIYVVAWAWFVAKYRLPAAQTTKPRPVNLGAKGVIVFALSLLLLSLKTVLSGIVVTFPFSGVFAVIEAKHALEPLAAVFTRNSVGILALLVTIRLLRPLISLWLCLIVAWVVYVGITTFLTKYVSMRRPA